MSLVSCLFCWLINQITEPISSRFCSDFAAKLEEEVNKIHAVTVNVLSVPILNQCIQELTGDPQQQI